ncbi:MAG: arginine--tRNA ligase [Clostridia bacterium]|nr:arginine--tRNA ligase [Clostridia bacterium]
MTKTKLKTAAAISRAVRDAFSAEISADEILPMLEFPPDASMGDLAFPCFKLSRALKKAPPVIASELCGRIGDGMISGAEVAGGYLNFRIDRQAFCSAVCKEAAEKGERYGAPDKGSEADGSGKTVVLDYSSPNIAKPFHIGHFGSTIIGHSIKNIYSFLGYKCVGINYLGDWGTQFGKEITAYKLWGDRDRIEKGGVDELVALYTEFHKKAEEDPSLEDRAREEFTKLERGDEENTALWKWFIDISLAEFKKTYDLLGVDFDSWLGESFFYKKTAAAVDMLREKGLLQISDGASIVDLSEYDMPPFLVLKRDGSTLYTTRDLASALYRAETYHFDKCLYVTASQQCLHFAQLFKVIEMAGFDWAKNMRHIPYGMVSVNGAKLATRTGNVVLLRDLLAAAIDKAREIIEQKNPDLENKDETARDVGIGAIIMGYLSGGRIKDINFIVEDALSFEGNTGPYAQYTYARTCSLLRRAEAAGLSPKTAFKAATEAEFQLCKAISLLPEKVLAAAEGFEPSELTRYAFDVCNEFNRFYQACPVLNEPDREICENRLAIVRAANIALANAMHLICVKTPEKI